MASVIKIHLVCDGCETPFGNHNQDRNVTEQRQLANQAGWVYQHAKDLCPECKPKPRARKTPEKPADPYAHF